MKLYAIRDKKSGKIYTELDVFSSFIGMDWDSEMITLRIEPTEPCEWCEIVFNFIPERYANICPNCGRSLK